MEDIQINEHIFALDEKNKNVTRNHGTVKWNDYENIIWVKVRSTYNVAIWRNPMLNGISPLNWLKARSLITTHIHKKRFHKMNDNNAEVTTYAYIDCMMTTWDKIIQDFKTCTIPDACRDFTREIIASHITADTDFKGKDDNEYFCRYICKEEIVSFHMTARGKPKEETEIMVLTNTTVL